MQLHTITRKTKQRRSRRIGRGGKRGTYSGRGIKGQKSRAGAKIRPALREIVKKIPKLRGYKFKSFRPKPAVVSLARLERAFPEGATVTPRALFEKGLVRRVKGNMPKVKILGRSALKKRLIFRDVTLSHSVQRKYQT